MGRKKKPTRVIKPGSIYPADRRGIGYFGVYKRILSRQSSKNNVAENRVWFNVKKPPTITTFLVARTEVWFGRRYVKVLITNTDQESLIGWIPQERFLGLICGSPVWEISDGITRNP